MTYRAAVLDDGVPEAVVAQRSQLLAVGAFEDQSFLQVAALDVFIGHAVPAVVGEVLVRRGGQQLQQPYLNSHRVGQLLLVPVGELKTDVRTRKNPRV